jgi:hypothetical protein
MHREKLVGAKLSFLIQVRTFMRSSNRCFVQFDVLSFSTKMSTKQKAGFVLILFGGAKMLVFIIAVPTVIVFILMLLWARNLKRFKWIDIKLIFKIPFVTVNFEAKGEMESQKNIDLGTRETYRNKELKSKKARLPPESCSD